MAKLEELELVYQPYNSAWRLPTSKGLRAFISYLMQETPEHFLQVRNDFNKKEIKNLWDFWNNLAFELSKNTGEIAFFISKKENVLTYSWIWSFLENNYSRLWNSVFSIIKMLEDKENFTKFISSFPMSPWINIFIWEENILPFLKDYTIIIKKLAIDSNETYVWLIWSLKMNYSFNISAVNGMI
jgi:transcriptional regulator of heat shock response